MDVDGNMQRPILLYTVCLEIKTSSAQLKKKEDIIHVADEQIANKRLARHVRGFTFTDTISCPI